MYDFIESDEAERAEHDEHRGVMRMFVITLFFGAGIWTAAIVVTAFLI